MKRLVLLLCLSMPAMAECGKWMTARFLGQTLTYCAQWLPLPLKVRGIVFPVDGGGSAIPVNKVVYFTLPKDFSDCAANSLTIDSTTAETVTVKFWKKAGGVGVTAIPTVSDSISTNGFTLSSGTAMTTENVADLSDPIFRAYDKVAMIVTAVTASQYIGVTLGCQQ